MTVLEMYHNFLLKSHSLDNVLIPDINAFDFLAVVNNAQDRFVDEMFANKRLDILVPFVTASNVLAASFSTEYTHGVQGASCVKLTSLTGYRFYIASQSNATRTHAPTVSSAKNIQNIPITRIDLPKYENNGTNKPVFSHPVELLEGSYLVVLPDAYTTLVSIYVTYLKNPQKLVISGPGSGEVATCELNANWHERIVDIALDIYLSKLSKGKE